MVNIPRCFRFVFILMLLGALSARAKDLGAYNVGDTADEDISTPVAFDAIDPVATAAKKETEAARTPIILRYYPLLTNEVVQNFLNLYDETHTNFLDALNKKFQTTTLDETIVASPDFADVLGAFNKKNKAFPLAANLAKAWALDVSDADEKTELMKYLGEGLRRPIAPDELPDGLQYDESVNIITLKSDEPLTLDEAQSRGKIGSMESFRKLSGARGILRRQFPTDEQTTGNALRALLKTNCVVDEELTKQARDAAVAQVEVPIHYDAGQIIVHKGDAITVTIKAALDQLAKNTGAIQMMKEQAEKAQQQAALAQQQAQLQQAQAKKIEQKATSEEQSALLAAQSIRAHEAKLFAEIGSVAVFAILAVVVVFYLKGKSTAPATVASAVAPTSATPLLEAASTPQPAATEIKKSLPSSMPFKVNIPPAAATKPLSTPPPLPSVSSEISAGGVGLKEAAEAEVTQLSQRLDKIFAPPYDRLRTYQLRLEDFQRELEQHGVQNRELVQLKIAALQRQIEIERKKFHL